MFLALENDNGVMLGGWGTPRVKGKLLQPHESLQNGELKAARVCVAFVRNTFTINYWAS